MKFALNEEQIALKETVNSVLSTSCTSENIRTAITSNKMYDEDLYKTLSSELSLLSLIVDEDAGGFGASDVELAVVSQEIGRFLAPTPLHYIFGTQMVIDNCVHSSMRTELFSKTLDPLNISVTVFDHEDSTIDVTKESNNFFLNGRFSRVPYGAPAKYLYFVCPNYDLFELDCGQSGVTQTVTPSIDQTQPLGAIECENVKVSLIAQNVKSEFTFAKNRMITCLCNSIVGSLQAVLQMSVSYAKDRNQFGRAIGSFQAIKHKCAEMLLETESSESISLFASWLASQGINFKSDELQDDLELVASMAKYYVCKAFNHCAGENIQIHGGIGFTMEHDSQLFFKRAAFMNAYLALPGSHAKLISKKLVS